MLLLSVSVPLSGLPRRPERRRRVLLLQQFRRGRKIKHLRQHPGGLVHRFLLLYPYQWRRRIAGSLIEIGRGRIDRLSFDEARWTAPAKGLVLVSVGY